MVEQRGDAFRRIRLCVDSYDDGVLRGRFYLAGSEDRGRGFTGLMQLLIGVETALDRGGFPRSYTAAHTFAPPGGFSHPESGQEAAPAGALATFVIRILFRRHASWQGSIKRPEEAGEHMFRSVLELILLLDSALRSGKEACGEGTFFQDP